MRCGYITSALKVGIPSIEGLEQTLHRSLDRLLGYIKGKNRRKVKAARLLQSGKVPTDDLEGAVMEAVGVGVEWIPGSEARDQGTAAADALDSGRGR